MAARCGKSCQSPVTAAGWSKYSAQGGRGRARNHWNVNLEKVARERHPLGGKYVKVLDWWRRKSFHRNPDLQPAWWLGAEVTFLRRKIPLLRRGRQLLCTGRKVYQQSLNFDFVWKRQQVKGNETPDGGLSCLQGPELEGAHPSVHTPGFTKAKCHLCAGSNTSGLSQNDCWGGTLKIPSLCFLTSHGIASKSIYGCCCIQISALLNAHLHEAGVGDKYLTGDETQKGGRESARETSITDHLLSQWPFLLHCWDNTCAFCLERRQLTVAVTLHKYLFLD